MSSRRILRRSSNLDTAIGFGGPSVLQLNLVAKQSSPTMRATFHPRFLSPEANSAWADEDSHAMFLGKCGEPPVYIVHKKTKANQPFSSPLQVARQDSLTLSRPLKARARAIFGNDAYRE